MKYQGRKEIENFHLDKENAETLSGIREVSAFLCKKNLIHLVYVKVEKTFNKYKKNNTT